MGNEMTNLIEKKYERAMRRREIFDRLSVGAEERMTPILSEAIDEIASRDAEVAELKVWNSELVKHQDNLADMCEQLRKDVMLLRVIVENVVEINPPLPMGMIEAAAEALAYTEHHDSS
jgi:FtsZ-binding cell division protein ZapB